MAWPDCRVAAAFACCSKANMQQVGLQPTLKGQRTQPDMLKPGQRVRHPQRCPTFAVLSYSSIFLYELAEDPRCCAQHTVAVRIRYSLCLPCTCFCLLRQDISLALSRSRTTATRSIRFWMVLSIPHILFLECSNDLPGAGMPEQNIAGDQQCSS